MVLRQLRRGMFHQRPLPIVVHQHGSQKLARPPFELLRNALLGLLICKTVLSRHSLGAMSWYCTWAYPQLEFIRSDPGGVRLLPDPGLSSVEPKHVVLPWQILLLPYVSNAEVISDEGVHCVNSLNRLGLEIN